MSNQSLIGTEIDEYKLTALLGEGGMASVYRAVDVRLKRDVAIKVIRAAFRSDSMYVERFEREAQAVAQLQHPNIITIYRYGRFDEGLYMAMQFVNGADLAAVIESHREDNVFIGFDEIIRLAHEIGAALDYAHSKGVIHRDVKPHNIMIDQDNRAIVTDFGLALLTEVGTRGEIFGSPHYIAPEQAISSAKVVPQSDLYALGVMLYEMLTGVVPFDAAEPIDVAMKHMTEPVPSPRALRPELSEAVEAVLLKILDKEPANRYETGKALAEALEQAFKSKPASKPVAAQKSVSPVSISQRLAMEFAENNPAPTVAKPSTPKPKVEVPSEIPPAVRISAAPKSSPIVERKSTNFPAYLFIGIGMVLVLGFLAFLFLPSLLGTNPESTATSSSEVSSLASESSASTNTEAVLLSATPNPTDMTSPTLTQTATGAPTATLTLSPTTASALVAATATPQVYRLEISWVGEDSLFVSNVGDLAFPLASLELVGSSNLNGTEWGLGQLESGQCVAVWKDSGNPGVANSSCQLLGARITRDGPNRFWKNSFDVYYNGSNIATCSSSPCNLEFNP